MATAPNSGSPDWSTPGPWLAEIEQSRKLAENEHWAEWEENLQYFTGKSKESTDSTDNGRPWVNVNADFTNCEVKKSQLFYETPDLVITSKGVFKEKAPAAMMPGQPPPVSLPSDPILAAHREILNDLLGPAGVDILPTIHKVIIDCLVTAGVGATKIGFYAAQDEVPAPAQLGAVLGLNQSVPRPLDECWTWDRIPSKKFRVPTSFRDTDFDKSPWIAHDFRMPLAMARQTLNVPDDYSGTTERDPRILDNAHQRDVAMSDLPYADGTEIWYYASQFDPDVKNPKVIRRHVLIDGIEGFVERTSENPNQTILPNGRLSADSMIGYPIHVLAIRSVPDSAFVPSDSTMVRPLVRELCTFRTQQVQERDANVPRVLYDIEKLPPDVIDRIQKGTVGSLIGVPPDTLMNGADKIMAQVTQGTQTRGSYTANDYIQHDLDKTLGLDSAGAGVGDTQSKTATEVGVVDRVRSVRLDHERRVILSWYLRGVSKFSALVCRYLTPALAEPLIGPHAAQVWGSWDKRKWDGRFVFTARPDSQIKLDAAAERKYALDIYQFLAKDPQVNRAKLLENLLQKAGLDPSEILQPPPPPKHPDPSLSFAFKGEDLLGPQAQQVREIMAQVGIKISQQAIDTSASQLFQQMLLGVRDAEGHAVKPVQPPVAEHGGTAEKVRPLNQQSADSSQQREGAPTHA